MTNLPLRQWKPQLDLVIVARGACSMLLGAAVFTIGIRAEAQRPVAVGISAGAAIPIADLGESHSTGFTVVAHLGMNIPRVPLGIRLEGFWNTSAARAEGIVVDNGDMRIAGGNVNVVYDFGGARIRPYVIGGVGAYNAKYVGATSVDFGINAGVGSRIRLVGLNTFAEARFHRISDDDRQFRFVPVTLGVEF